MGTMKVEVYLADGSTEVLTLATERVVCPRCHGNGVHDAWDNGMTGDEMAEQGPEFIEDYMSGVYDVQCTECKGRNVVDEVDRNHNTASALDKYDAHMQAIYELDAMYESERRLGA